MCPWQVSQPVTEAFLSELKGCFWNSHELEHEDTPPVSTHGWQRRSRALKGITNLCEWVVPDQGVSQSCPGEGAALSQAALRGTRAFAHVPPHTLWLREFREMLLRSHGSARMSVPPVLRGAGGSQSVASGGGGLPGKTVPNHAAWCLLLGNNWLKRGQMLKQLGLRLPRVFGALKTNMAT